MSTLLAVRDFLDEKRIAMIGVSRNPHDFSRVVFSELRSRGYDVVPVNPVGDEIDGVKCFHHVQDILPPVDSVLLMTVPQVTREVVRECSQAGVKRVWMHRGGGKGAVDHEAVVFCRARDIIVIDGECPFMFLPETGWFHRLHGGVRKLFGGYPH